MRPICWWNLGGWGAGGAVIGGLGCGAFWAAGREFGVASALVTGGVGGLLGLLGAWARQAWLGEISEDDVHPFTYTSAAIHGPDSIAAYDAPVPLRLAGAPSAHDGVIARLDSVLADHRELEERCAFLDRVVAAIPDPIIIMGPGERILQANAAAGSALGFDPDAVVDRLVSQVLTDQAMVDRISEAVGFTEQTPSKRFEHSVGSGDRERTWDVTVAQIPTDHFPQPADGGDCVILILRDVTEQNRLLEKKTDFVSSVSHELRTPLASIKAYMEMLIDGEDHDLAMRTEFYGIVHAESERLGRLIDTLTDIGRIESGSASAQRERVDLGSVVKQVVSVMRPQASAKGIDLDVAGCEMDPVYVAADWDMIYRATMNLLSNALKYTLRNGSVTVRLHNGQLAGWAGVSITDTGVGIPPDDLPRVFDKCYRVPEHRKLAKGSGLGLNLVRQIIEVMHAGRVDAESTVGRGSTFTYRLPIAENEQGVVAIDPQGGVLTHARS